MRITIRPNDIETLYGITYQSASRLLCNIRIALGKQPRQKLTISEFCKYESIPESEVIKALEPYLKK